MKHFFQAAALAILAVSSAVGHSSEPTGEAVFHEHFEDAAGIDARLDWEQPPWRCVDGCLRSVTDSPGMRIFEVRSLALRDWRLSFAVKRFSVPATDQHFGVIFSYDDGTTLRIYCRGRTVHVWDQADGRTRKHGKVGKDLGNPLPSGDQAQWTPFLISARGAHIQVDVGGVRIGTMRREPALLESAQFYAYNLDCGFDDIRFDRLRPDAEPTQALPPELALHAAFEGTTDIRAGKSESGALADKGVSFTDGVFGQAVRIGAGEEGNPLLKYDAGDAFGGAGGTVMFWFRPEWDGAIQDPQRFPWYGLFSTRDGNDKKPLRIWQWHWLRADLSRGADAKGFSLYNRCRGAWRKGDWHHVALVWNEEDWCTLYVDGIPYERGLTGARYLPQRQRAALDGVRTFSLGSLRAGGPMKAANGAFDELRIYRTALSADQVVSEFRRALPIDLILERRFVRAERVGVLVLALHPGGRMVVPMVSKEAGAPVAVKVQTRLVADSTGETIAESMFDGRVEDEILVPVAFPPLAVGTYRLVCTVLHGDATVRRSFPIVAYALSPPGDAIPDGLQLGDPTRIVHCADDAMEASMLSSAATVKGVLGGVAYREAGAEKADRFAFEMEFPEAQQQGNPVLLEIVWPDDKPRSMGLYMYPEAERRQHRDRLEGGVQSGDEYPVSGELKTTRYLFYPDRRRYLFEARTMVPDMPAAVVSVAVRPLTAPLPRLAIDFPKKTPHRMLGHMDEDMTFEILFRKGAHPDQAVRHLETLCNYLDYTGQELISYPLLRYYAAFYPVSGPYPGGGLRPEGWIDLFLEVFAARGKRLIGSVNLSTLPELHLLPSRIDDLIEEGMFTRDARGDLVHGTFGYVPNPVHPVVRAAFLRHIGEVLRRYGSHQAFAGIDIWRTPLWSFSSLEHGYDDDTVGRFEAETGISVPCGMDRARFRERHAFLTGSGRVAWLAWRAAKSTAMIAEISRMARAVQVDLPVYVRLGITPWEQGADAPDLASRYFRDLGVDVDALRELPSVVLVPQRHPTSYRHKRHWDNSENRHDEVAYDPVNTTVFRAPGRAMSVSYLRYFESFNNSLKPEVYNSYFQNADVKGHGRFFLKDFAFCLATMDTTRMLIGAQPLGTAGRDRVTREFARAYCALPALGFENVDGPVDPVTVRYRTTKEGTYVYAVNTLCFPARADCLFTRNSEGVDLSTGASVRIADKRLAVELAPFQLRSFRFPRRLLFQTKPVRVETHVSEDTMGWYATHVAAIEDSVRIVGESGVDVAALHRRVGALKHAFSEGAYAEAHRLLFAKDILELDRLSEAARQGFLGEQSRMMAESAYAVNCGKEGFAFLRAASGALFFPDQPFKRGSYGHVGSYKSVIRSVAGLVGTSDSALYATEAYDIDGYRFTVKPGVYTVRLHMKVGYQPNAKPGVFVIDVDLEGKRVLTGADLFLLSGSDFHQAVIKEFRGIVVRDGVLDIVFRCPEGGNPTARLCNAIEVIPGK